MPDPRGELAVVSLIDLADDLGLRLIALGLDTLSIAEHAKEVGITSGQGAAIGREPPIVPTFEVSELAHL